MKLWFFRTPDGRYAINDEKPDQMFLQFVDSGKPYVLGVLSFSRKPRGLPALEPGDCIPVELVPAGKGKKARK